MAVSLLWFVGGSAYLTRTMLTTMRGSVLQDIPMTDAQFGLLTSFFLWFYAAVGPLGGFIGDLFRRRRVILISLFLWSAVTVFTAYARTFSEFLLLRALLGLAQACYVPTGIALITDFHRGSTRAFATGLNLTGMICGSLIGASCGWIADRHGWQFAFQVIGWPSMALVAVVAWLLRDSEREDVPASAPPVRFWPALRSLAKPGPFTWFIASMAVQGAVSWIIIGWMPTVIRERFHLGQGAAGFSALGLLYIAQVIGQLAGGWASDRWTRTNPRARILLPAAAIVLASPVFMFAAFAPQLGLLLAGLAAYGLAMGCMGSNQMAVVCLLVDARYRATAMGVLNAGTAIAGGVAVYGVGAMRDAGVGVGAVLLAAGIGTLACGLMLAMIHRSLSRQAA